MKDARRHEPVLPRGRVAKWSREQMDKLSTPDLRALLENAERLKEPEVAALCSDLLDGRPHGHSMARRRQQASQARRLVTRGKAFELNGVSVRSRLWSRGGQRGDGAVLLMIRADEVERAGDANRCLLWGPNVGDSRPWADSPGGKERQEQCRTAVERGATQGLLIYGKRGSADRVDAENVLNLEIEQRGEEYWASWV